MASKQTGYAGTCGCSESGARGVPRHGGTRKLRQKLNALGAVAAGAGSAYCIDMHSKDARAAGETEQRLYALSAWRETPFFTDRERAALAWTEAITLISSGHAPDEVYEEVQQRLTEEELVNLTLAIVAINGWNRLAIGFRAVPGSYQPTGQSVATAKSR